VIRVTVNCGFSADAMLCLSRLSLFFMNAFFCVAEKPLGRGIRFCNLAEAVDNE
jgi:hypothetical protein